MSSQNREEAKKLERKTQEHLEDWDSEKDPKLLDVYPKAKFGTVFESLRHTFRQDQACSVFCKGKQCKYDNDKWPDDLMAIKGIYSTWITKNILAMARPNTVNILKHDMVDQFKRNGIKSIINLELPGEHASCGHGLEPSGFSYNQHHFMDADIFCYNFGWPDWSVGSLNNVLDVVRVMQFALTEGKVAIHCHAGHGRTGVLIACYLVFANRMSPWESVYYVRSKRSHCLQTESQVQFVMEFHQFLRPFWVIYSTNQKDDPKSQEFTLAQFLSRQLKILHGTEARKLKYVPKILSECSHQLLKLAGQVNAAPIKLDRTAQHGATKAQKNGGKPLQRHRSLGLESVTPSRNIKARRSSSESSTSISSNQNNNALYDSDTSSCAESWHQSLADVPKMEAAGIAMATTEYDEETINQVEALKKTLNTESCGYEDVTEVSDPTVVAKLMWDWLDGLKEPVLQAQDLPHMLDYTDSPRSGLKLLNRGARHTVELLFKTIAKLEPLSDETERSVVQRVLSTLTHQNMVVEMELLFSSDKKLIRRTSNNSGLMTECVTNKMMYFFMHLLHLIQVDLENESANVHQVQQEKLHKKSRARDVGGSGDGTHIRETPKTKPRKIKGAHGDSS